jgi:hypothetical protein
MKPLRSDPIATRPDVLRAKYAYGVWFGIALGLTFSIFAWGIDAYRLQQINGLYPWLMFLGGAVPCTLVGGLTGWLAARLDKPIFALILWAVAASIFAWLTVSLPLQILPRLLSLAEPGLTGLLHYRYFPEFASRVGVAYAWLVIFVSIAGLLQIPLSESAVFATSPLGKFSPILITLVLMAICGTIVDGLNNELLRSPIETVNEAIQFSIDHRGKQIDPAESRKMHLIALRTVQDRITPERKFIVSGYDQFLEQVEILAHFQQSWVECLVINNQLSMCHPVDSTP